VAFSYKIALSNVPNINVIIDRFPKKPTMIIGTPTFQTLIKLKLDLQDNASSVPSNLGGAQNGYLGLILAAPAYAAIVSADATGAPQPFIAPTFTGAVPTIVGINEVAREAELCKFEADTYAWRKYNNMCYENTSYQLWMMCTSRPRKQDHLVITRSPFIGASIHAIWRHQFGQQ
jgi:hypothetical protein